MKKMVLMLLVCFSGLAIAALALAGLSDYLEYVTAAPLAKMPEHGTEFIVEADLSPASGNTNMVLLEKTLQKRFSGINARVFMEPVSASQLRIALPAAESNLVEDIVENITRGGFLELKLVNDNSDEIIRSNKPIPPGYEVLHSLEQAPHQNVPELLVVKKNAENGLAGSFVQSAVVAYDKMGQPQIEFEMNENATARFARVTTEYAPDNTTGIYHRIAIVLDGQLYSAPRIDEPITEGLCMISGNFTREKAQRLAQFLNDPLPIPVKIIERKSF